MNTIEVSDGGLQEAISSLVDKWEIKQFAVLWSDDANAWLISFPSPKKEEDE